MTITIDFEGNIPYNTKHFKYDKTWWLLKIIEKEGNLICTHCGNNINENSIATITKKVADCTTKDDTIHLHINY